MPLESPIEALDLPSIPREFVHLHNHTDFSILDGTARISALVAATVSDGQRALAITDHGSLGGAWRFQSECLAAGIKPIIGMEAYLAIGSRHDPGVINVEHTGEDSTKTKSNEHLTLLCRNEVGWRNLLQIHNEAERTFYRKPLTDYDFLADHAEGLICLTGCLGGPVAGPLSRGYEDVARKNLTRLIEIFGSENVYVEMMNHGIDAEAENPRKLSTLALEFALPVLVTNDCHYVREEDQPAHDAQLANATGARLDTVGRYSFNGSGYHLRSAAEMYALMSASSWRRGCEETVRLADRCADFVIPEPVLHLPKFELPDGWASSREYFHSLILAGAKRRYGALTVELKSRLRHEEDVICEAGYDNYFLIAHDMMKFCQKQGIVTGWGRGSAAGSAVSYCLGLVHTEPLANKLLFERFLEPGRAGLPDIDFDIEASRRDEVVKYLRDRYGDDRVARIGTYGFFRSKAAVKASGRLLDQVGPATAIAKAIPVEQGKPLNLHSLETGTFIGADRFRDEVGVHASTGEDLLELAHGLEGLIQSQSIHACGIVISDVPLATIVPIRRDHSAKARPDDLGITSWDGNDIEAYGMLKLDLLGLRNLDVIAATFNILDQSGGPVMGQHNIPHPDTVDDPSVRAAWDLIQDGRTSGVFQMDGSGMQAMARDVAPSSLEELSAVLALFRPGPIQSGMTANYVERKHGRELLNYSAFTDDPVEQKWIASVLGDTYGVFVYQEQVMELGRVIAGFDAKARSLLRKAVGKKKVDLMAQVGDMLLAGAPHEITDDAGSLVSPQFAEATARRVFDIMKGSADYLFNRSHSTAYAQVAFVTAYLKANFPAAYGAALLSVTDKDDKRRASLDSLRQDGIEVFGPSVNASAGETSSDGQTVRLGLSEIKSVGKAGQLIATERQAGGPFKSLSDLLPRVNSQSPEGERITTLTVEGLIAAGALDEFGPRRSLIKLARASERADLPVEGSEWGSLERYTREMDRLGIFTGIHPVHALADQIAAWEVPAPGADELKLRRGLHWSEQQALRKCEAGARPDFVDDVCVKDGETRFVVGLLSKWESRENRRGTRAHFSVEGATGMMTGVAWPSLFSNLLTRGRMPTPGQIVAVLGTLRTRTIERESIDESGEPVISSFTTTELQAANIWIVPTSGFDVSSVPAQEPIDFGQLLTDSRQLAASNVVAASVSDTVPSSGAATPTEPQVKQSETDNVIDLQRQRSLRRGPDANVFGPHRVYAMASGISVTPQLIVDGLEPLWTGFQEGITSASTIAAGLDPGLYRSENGDDSHCWFLVVQIGNPMPSRSEVSGLISEAPHLDSVNPKRRPGLFHVSAA